MIMSYEEILISKYPTDIEDKLLNELAFEEEISKSNYYKKDEQTN